ncbi:MAG: hypothetical protein AAF515_06565 [Pseudomonadota bacterium]
MRHPIIVCLASAVVGLACVLLVAPVNAQLNAGSLVVQFGSETLRLAQPSRPATLSPPGGPALALGPSLPRSRHASASVEVGWFANLSDSENFGVAVGLSGAYQTPSRYYDRQLDDPAATAADGESYALRMQSTRAVEIANVAADVRVRLSWNRYRLRPYLDFGAGWVRHRVRVSEIRALGSLTGMRGADEIKVDFDSTIRSGVRRRDRVGLRMQAGLELPLDSYWSIGLSYRIRNLGAFDTNAAKPRRRNAAEIIALDTTLTIDDQISFKRVRTRGWQISLRRNLKSHAVSIR